MSIIESTFVLCVIAVPLLALAAVGCFVADRIIEPLLSRCCGKEQKA